MKLPQILREHTLLVLDPLGLIQDQVLVVDVRKLALFSHTCFKRCQDDVIFVGMQNMPLLVALLTIPVKLENSK